MNSVVNTVNQSPEQRPKVRTYPSPAEQDVDKGYRSCRQHTKKLFGDRTWLLMNLPGEVRRGVDAVLFVACHGIEAWRRSRPTGQISFDLINEARDDLNDACSGKYVANEWSAVHDMLVRWQVPKQFLFDLFEGLDHVLRFRQPQSYADVENLATRLGGAPFAAAVQIMGFTRPGFETLAYECGRSLLIAEWLLSAHAHAAAGHFFLASDDMAQSGCDRDTLASNNYSKPVDYLVRTYTNRLEKAFHHAAGLFDYLDFDANRTVRGYVGLIWRALLRLQREPRLLMSPEGPLSKKVLFAEKTRFVLGLADGLPFVSHAH